MKKAKIIRDGDLCLSLRAVADELDLSTATLRRLIKAGHGPVVVRAGRRWWKVRRSDLDNYIDSHTVRPRLPVEAAPQAAAA
jgi:predicted DNA-binding transcriptional regulator AlpA